MTARRVESLETVKDVYTRTIWYDGSKTGQTSQRAILKYSMLGTLRPSFESRSEIP